MKTALTLTALVLSASAFVGCDRTVVVENKVAEVKNAAADSVQSLCVDGMAWVRVGDNLVQTHAKDGGYLTCEDAKNNKGRKTRKATMADFIDDTTPQVGAKNAQGKIWTGKRWL